MFGLMIIVINKYKSNSFRHHLPPQPSMPYQRQNPNQCEIYTNQIKSLLPTYAEARMLPVLPGGSSQAPAAPAR